MNWKDKFKKEFCFHTDTLQDGRQWYCDIKGELPPTISPDDIISFIEENFVEKEEYKELRDLTRETLTLNCTLYTKDQVLDFFKAIEKEKWDDAEHCSCLGYAIHKFEHE